MSAPTTKHHLSGLFYLSVLSVPFSYVFNLSGVRLTTTEILFSITFLSWFAGIFQTHGYKPELPPLTFPIALFLSACLLSSIFAANRFAAFRETIQFLWLFSIYFFIVSIPKDRTTIRIVLSLSILAGTVISVFGLYQHFFLREPLDFLINETRIRAYATFGQPNAFGSYLTGVIPLSIGLYVSGEDRMLRLLALASIFVMSLALFATFSRGSWVGLTLAAGVIGILAPKPVPKTSFILPFIAIMLSAGIIWFGSMWSGTVTLLNRQFSNSQRLLLAESAVAMTRDHPFLGAGPGNYPILLPQYASQELKESFMQDIDPKTKRWFKNPDKKMDVEIVHNIFLQTAAETGIAGLAVFLWLLYRCYGSSFKALKHAASKEECTVRISLIGSFTAIMAGGLFGWPFTHGVQEVLIMSMALSAGKW